MRLQNQKQVWQNQTCLTGNNPKSFATQNIQKIIYYEQLTTYKATRVEDSNPLLLVVCSSARGG